MSSDKEKVVSEEIAYQASFTDTLNDSYEAVAGLFGHETTEPLIDLYFHSTLTTKWAATSGSTIFIQPGRISSDS